LNALIRTYISPQKIIGAKRPHYFNFIFN